MVIFILCDVCRDGYIFIDQMLEEFLLPFISNFRIDLVPLGKLSGGNIFQRQM